MNVVGEGFPESIIQQVTQRQKIYGSGYAQNRTPEEIIFLNANTSWVKLVSSVDIINQKIIQDESLKNLSGISGTELAKQFVLFNGTVDQSGNSINQREGIDTTGDILGRDILGNGKAYGIGGTEFGIRPMMGIQSAEIKHRNRGSIRTASVKIKAFNKVQFDIIDVLYLRLGFSVLLEWGHSMYYDNNGVLQKGAQLNNSLADAFLSGKRVGPFKNPTLTYSDFLDLIQEKRISSNGNYDAMFGKVVNFHWSFLPDGSYDITLDLVSIGDIIESFKINVLTEGIQNSTKTNNSDQTPTPGEIIDLYANQSSIGQYFFKLKKEAPSTDSFSLTFGNSDKKQEIWYVRLGALLQFIEEKIMYYSKIGDSSTPLLKFDYDIESNLMYVETKYQTSIDPSICVVNRNVRGYNVAGSPPKGELFESSLFSNLNTTYGQIMNIYVSTSWILTKLNELKEASTNKVVLIDFLNTILTNINGTLGGTSNLEATINEVTNTVIIRDANPLPYLEEVIKILNEKGYNINDKYAQFDLYGYNSTTNGASFIKDFSFTTEITPELSNMITVGATANSEVVGENSTAFSKFNNGLKDRFKETITQGSESTPGTVEEITSNWGFNSPELEETRRKQKEQIAANSKSKAALGKFAKTLANYDIYLQKLQAGSFTSEEAETYKDVVTNLITYEEQWWQAVLNREYIKRNLPPPNTLSPTTGFIPFNLSLTMDGLSGMKIYSKFFIDTKFLPANYPDNAEFLIRNITHKIENNKWFTNLESFVISKGKETYNAKSTNQQTTSGGSSSSTSTGNTRATRGNPSLRQVIIAAGYPEGTKEYTFALSIGTKEGWSSTANGGVGSRSYRNNNPGNLVFSNNLRKIDPNVTLENNPYGANRFAHFTTAELGAKALVEAKIKRWGNGSMPVTPGNTTLIEQKKGGPKYKLGALPTIAQFVYTYAPPNENNTELYISNLLTDLKKVKPDTTRTTLVKQFFT